MRGVRGGQSLSSVSTRSLSSDKNRHRSSRHSVDSEISSRKYHRKMKFIIAVGIALPIIAAIIGVVAWAVSADSAFRSPAVKSLRRSDVNNDEDIFQILEDRHDPPYTHPSPFVQKSPSKDSSRVEQLSSARFDDTGEKDPLYIVHFVPTPKPRVEASTVTPGFASTVSSDVLQKILSASKGTKPGTPQFVVFAPLPSAEDDKGNSGDLSSMGSSGMNFLAKPPAPNPEIDYDYEEELQKYQELLDGKDPKESSTKSSEPTKQSVQVVAKNYTSGSVYLQQPQLNSPESNSISPQQYNQQYQQNVPETEPYPQQGYNQPQQGYKQPQQDYNQPQQVYNQPQQGYNQPQQGYNQPQQGYNLPQKDYNQPQQVYNQPQLNYDNQQNVYGSPQQLYPPPGEQSIPVYQPGHQPQSVDRSGHYEPLGIKLSLGNDGHGQKGLLGGGYSPLGIISSILSPVVRRPKVNLNGKLMFGVMLEKGVKFGDEKRHVFG